MLHLLCLFAFCEVSQASHLPSNSLVISATICRAFTRRTVSVYWDVPSSNLGSTSCWSLSEWRGGLLAIIHARNLQLFNYFPGYPCVIISNKTSHNLPAHPKYNSQDYFLKQSRLPVYERLLSMYQNF